MNTILSGVHMMQIIAFITVVNENGFAKAAPVLHLTQPAVTKSIARLEKELNLKLFERTTRQLALTPAGKQLYDTWQPLLAQMQAAYQTALTSAAQQDLHLNIATTSTTNPESYFWPRAAAFEQEHPEIELNIESDSMEVLCQKICTGEYDIVFVPDFEHYTMDNYHIPWKWIAKSYTCAIIPCTHPYSEKSFLTIEDIKDEPLIILDPAYYPNYLHCLKEIYGAKGYTPIIRKTYRNAYTIKHLCRETQCILLADDYFDLPKDANIKVLPVIDAFNGIICAWRPAASSSSIEKFVQYFPEAK